MTEQRTYCFTVPDGYDYKSVVVFKYDDIFDPDSRTREIEQIFECVDQLVSWDRSEYVIQLGLSKIIFWFKDPKYSVMCTLKLS